MQLILMTDYFLEQLVSLEDIEDEEIRFLKSPVDRAHIHGFFEGQIKALQL